MLAYSYPFPGTPDEYASEIRRLLKSSSDILPDFTGFFPSEPVTPTFNVQQYILEHRRIDREALLAQAEYDALRLRREDVQKRIAVTLAIIASAWGKKGDIMEEQTYQTLNIFTGTRKQASNE